MRNKLIKLSEYLLKLSSPYPKGDYNYYESSIKNNEIYHAVTRPTTVVDIITNQQILPFGGINNSLEQKRIGFVSMSAKKDLGTFGDYIIVFDWECISQQNLGLLPMRYVDINEIIQILGWGSELAPDVRNFPEQTKNKYNYSPDMVDPKGAWEDLLEVLFDLYPFLQTHVWKNEEEVRSYDAVSVVNCIKYIEFIGEGNHQISNSDSTYTTMDDAPKWSNDTKWSPEDFLLMMGNHELT